MGGFRQAKEKYQEEREVLGVLVLLIAGAIGIVYLLIIGNIRNG